MTSGVFNGFFLDDLVNGLAPQSVTSLYEVGTILLITLSAASVAVLATAVVYVTAATLSSYRNTKDGEKFSFMDTMGSIALFFTSLLVPLAALASGIRRTASALLAFLVGNWQTILFVLIITPIAWLITVYFPELVSAVATIYSGVIVPVYSGTVMYGVMVVRYYFDNVQPWVNLLVVRIPSVIVTGTFFDSATCAEDAWSLFFQALVQAGIEFANAFIVWLSTGTDALYMTPDFVPFGEAVGNVFFSLRTFFVCICASGSVLLDPLFKAIAVGAPAPYTNDPSAFACAINSTFNIPIAFGIDFVRPIVLGSEAVEAGDDFLEVMDAMDISFDGTLDTSKNALNCTLRFGTNIMQQYYVWIIDAVNPNLTSIPGPPPVFFECATGVLWAPVEIIKWFVTLVVNFLNWFTYDGQKLWWFDNVIDSLRDSLRCACLFVEWFGGLSRRIGDLIAGDGQCDSITSGDIGSDIGGCVFYVVGNLIDFVCCISRESWEFVFDLILVVWKLFIGTIYTIVANVADFSGTRCDVIDPDDVFYCSVPNSIGEISIENSTFAVGTPFNFWAYQVGERRDRTMCPTGICSLPTCSSDSDCSDTDLVGIATYCDVRIDRCIHTAEATCSGSGPVFPRTNCVQGDITNGGICSSSFCQGFTCENAPIDEFLCDCDCTPNEWRIAMVHIVKFFECFNGCIFSNLASFVIELFMYFIDFSARIGLILFDSAADANVSTQALFRAFEGLCDCFAVFPAILAESFGSPEAGLKSALTIGRIVRCICRIFVLVVDAVLFLISDIFIFIIDFEIAGNAEKALVSLLVAIVNAFGLIFYVLALFIYAFSFNDPGLIDAGDSLILAGDTLKEIANELAQAIIDILLGLLDCIVGLGLFFANLIICIGNLSIGEECAPDLFDPLLDCLVALGRLLFEFIDLLCGGCLTAIGCFIQEVGCFVGYELNPALCSTITVAQCNDLNIICNIEDFFCVFGFEVDLEGCPTSEPCEARPLICAGADIACSIDIISWVAFGTVSEITDTVPAECCTSPVENFVDPTNIDLSLPCAEPLYIHADFFSETDENCLLSVTGCWSRFANNAEIFATGVVPQCCQSMPTTSTNCPAKKRDYKRSIDETLFVAPVYNSSIETFEEYNVRVNKAHAAWMVIHPFKIPDDIVFTPTSPLPKPTTEQVFKAIRASSVHVQLSNGCMRMLEEVVPASSIWPPVEHLLSPDIGMPNRFRLSTCINLLKTHANYYDVKEIIRYQQNNEGMLPKNNKRNHMIQQDYSLFLWPVTYSLSTFIHTNRMLWKYAIDVDNEQRTQALIFGFIGASSFQLRPEHCTAVQMPAAVLADFLTPTIGNVMRGVYAGFVAAISKSREREIDPTIDNISPVVKSFRTAVQLVANVSSKLDSAKLMYAAVEIPLNIKESTSARLKRSNIRIPTIRDVHAVARAVTQPHSPENALTQHRIAVRSGLTKETPHIIAMRETNAEKRSTGGGNEIWEFWHEEILSKMNDRVTLLMREVLYSNTNRTQLLTNDGCDLRTSPFECCETQNVCINCSLFDRISWATQNGFDCIAEYYSGDYLTRFTPCLVQDSETVNRMVIPPSLKCPASICAAPECSTDAECSITAGTNIPSVCNTDLGRCILESDAQCAGPEFSSYTCFEEVGANTCRVGQCVAGACTTIPTDYACDCQCDDTYLTVDKRIPFLLERLTMLEVPCVLNPECVAESILPPGFDLTVPENNEFKGSFVERKTRGDPSTPNVDLEFLDALSVTFDGLGDDIITAIEDTIYRITYVLDQEEILENFFNVFIFCDYKDDWFCPLTDDSPDGCCSDRCEERKQGTNLFNGIIWAIIVWAVVVLFLTLCPLCRPVSWLYTAIFLVFFIPLAQMYAFGGGLLCYTIGPLYLILPGIIAIAGLFGVCMNTICCGRVGNTCASMARLVCRIIGIFLIFTVSIPATSVCTGLDVYNIFLETIPPCFPVPMNLIDRTDPASSNVCGTFLAEGESAAPPVINCLTTDLLTQTRFLDGLDNIFYIIEAIRPGTNEEIASATATGEFSWLNSYANSHTTAAHEASEPYTTTCFWLTLLNIWLSLILLIIQALLVLLIAGLIGLLLALLIYPLFWAAYAIGKMLKEINDGFIDTAPMNKGGTSSSSSSTSTVKLIDV